MEREGDYTDESKSEYNVLWIAKKSSIVIQPNILTFFYLQTPLEDIGNLDATENTITSLPNKEKFHILFCYYIQLKILDLYGIYTPLQGNWIECLPV